MADKIGTDEYGEILIYQTDDGQTNIEVKIEDDTVWLTQQQLTELYQCSKSNISEHIKHIFEEGELDALYLNFSDPWPKKKPTAWITAIRENTTPTAPVALLLWSWPTK